MSQKVTRIKYCSWCGEPFELKSPNQKYCSSKEKKCSVEAKRENWRKASSKYRKKYKHISIPQLYKMGSGFLSSTPQKNFNLEYEAIQKEKKRLRLQGLLGFFPLGVEYALNTLRSNPMMILFVIMAVIMIIIVVFIINDSNFKI